MHATGSRTHSETSQDPDPALVSDATLVQRANSGDEGAFGEIVERHRLKVFAIALVMLRNHADAEEITQDAFVSAYRNLAGFRGDSSLATWLHRIAVNLAHNRYWYYFRRHRHNLRSLDRALSNENPATFSDLIADARPDPAQETARQEFTALIATCMEELEGEHAEILTLRSVLHHSYGEIASIIGIPVGTVKSRLARARECLRAALARNCPEFTIDSNPHDWFVASATPHGLVACA